MTAHVVYAAVDPDAPATQSARVVQAAARRDRLRRPPDDRRPVDEGAPWRLRRARGTSDSGRLRRGPALQRRPGGDGGGGGGGPGAGRPRRWRAPMRRWRCALPSRPTRRGGARARVRRADGRAPMPDDFFDADVDRRAPRRRGARRRRRRLRGAARPAPDAGAEPEGRPAPDLDPEARRAVPRLRRGGEAAPDRARRRLPGDGGLARLPEVAAAAAARPRGGGAERRRPRRAPRLPAAAARGDARRRRPADGARPARPRRLRPRRGRGGDARPPRRPHRDAWSS